MFTRKLVHTREVIPLEDFDVETFYRDEAEEDLLETTSFHPSNITAILRYVLGLEDIQNGSQPPRRWRYINLIAEVIQSARVEDWEIMLADGILSAILDLMLDKYVYGYELHEVIPWTATNDTCLARILVRFILSRAN